MSLAGQSGWRWRARHRLRLAARLQPLVFLLFALGSPFGEARATADRPLGAASSPKRGLSFAIADFDGDQRPDLAGIEESPATTFQTDYRIEIHLSAAGNQMIQLVAPAGGLEVVARDVNGDQAADLILTTAWSREPVAIYLNDGHGRFTRAEASAFPEAFAESQWRWDTAGLEIAGVSDANQEGRLGSCPKKGWHRSALPVACRPAQPDSPVPTAELCALHPGRAPPTPLSLT